MVSTRQRTRSRRESAAPPFRWFAAALPWLLVGYLFFGRPFAYLHIPGTPIFIGEIVLAVGLVEAVRVGPTLWALLRVSRPAQTVAVFFSFGAVLLGTDLARYGLLAMRDSAIWYYAAFSFLVSATIMVRPEVLQHWLRQYRRVLPAFLLWVPIGIVLARTRLWQVMIPDSGIALLGFKPGDLAVSAGIAVAYLWLVHRPSSHAERRWRTTLTVVAGLGLLVAGTQNRGGFVAAAVIVAGALLLTPDRTRLMVTGALALVVAVAIGAVVDVRLPLSNRELSVEQLGENITSLVDPDRATGTNLEGNIVWRQRLWTATAADVLAGPALVGFGFGPNLAERYGFGIHEGLRNPHNSHLSVLARMGLVGLTLWVTLWSVWLQRLLRMTRRRTYHGPRTMSSLAAWCAVSAVGFLVNAGFDPSLEGPQAGVWLWIIVGLGIGISAPRLRPAPSHRALGPVRLPSGHASTASEPGVLSQA